MFSVIRMADAIPILIVSGLCMLMSWPDSNVVLSFDDAIPNGIGVVVLVPLVVLDLVDPGN